MRSGFRLQKYRNGGQLWVVNVFSYTIHAQIDCWQSCFPLALSIFSPSYCDVSEARSYFASTIQQSPAAGFGHRGKKENLCPCWESKPAVQPVVSSYTDWGTMQHSILRKGTTATLQADSVRFEFEYRRPTHAWTVLEKENKFSTASLRLSVFGNIFLSYGSMNTKKNNVCLSTQSDVRPYHLWLWRHSYKRCCETVCFLWLANL
jgi:hypothetical protein